MLQQCYDSARLVQCIVLYSRLQPSTANQWSVQTTGLPSLEAVAQHFEAAEERSLGLLTYVNDLQSEVEALEDHVAGLRGELARLQRPPGGGQDALTEVPMCACPCCMLLCVLPPQIARCILFVYKYCALNGDGDGLRHTECAAGAGEQGSGRRGSGRHVPSAAGGTAARTNRAHGATA